MKQIFRGMDNTSIDVINGNFNDLSKVVVKNVKIGQLNGTLTRSNNSVTLSIPVQPWPYKGASAWTVAYDMNIPAGYRPTNMLTITAINNYESTLVKVNADGSMWFTDKGIVDNLNFEAYGTWETADDMPQ